ncbi:MAG: hypothetical protein DRJ03_01750 [Chloroflexi bacterium]|nr:MAG: hypothetical protein DRJ03_01750 [Chloroflexota bacterium]
MARPKKWFESKEYNVAKKTAKSSSMSLFKFARQTRDHGVETGYYVGNKLPTRLASAKIEQKKV